MLWCFQTPLTAVGKITAREVAKDIFMAISGLNLERYIASIAQES
jgi:hypothetical protein